MVTCDSLREYAVLAPLATASIATLALVVAAASLFAQKQIARRRAAIDFFLKTEMDSGMVAAYFAFRAGLDALTMSASMEQFVDSKTTNPSAPTLMASNCSLSACDAASWTNKFVTVFGAAYLIMRLGKAAV